MPQPAVPTDQTKTPARAVQPEDLKTWPGRLKALFKRFSSDKVPVMAAALTFFSLLSIVPVLLLALAMLGFFMYQAHASLGLEAAAQEAVNQMTQSIGKLLPGTTAKQAFGQLAEQINLQQSLVDIIRQRGTALIIGLLSLTWAAMQIFVNASGMMNLAFDVEETRSWIKLRLDCLKVLMGAAVLFLLSLLPSSGPDFVRNLHIPWLGLPDPSPGWLTVLFWGLALAVNMFMFAFIYKFLPNTRVDWKAALAGGFTMGALWEIAKQGFALYLRSAGDSNKMYGALGGVILIITWLYYTNILLLLGAEVAGLYNKVRKGSNVPDPALQHQMELDAVHSNQAVPLAAGPMGAAAADGMTADEAKQRLRERTTAISGHFRSMGAAVSSMVHGIKTAPERNRSRRRSRRRPRHQS